MFYSGLVPILAAVPVTFVAAAPKSLPLQVRADADSYPPSQPIPQLLKDNPDLFYWPAINEPGALTAEYANQSDGIIRPQDGNWFGTGLFGYDECKKRGLNKAKIDDAYYDMYYLTNVDGIYKDVDWNSAAAVEYLAPPANNMDYQARMQKMLLLASGTWKTWGVPAIHHIHVRCDDPAKACTKGCNPDGTPIASDTIAYTSQDDGDGYTSMNFCPRFFDMRRLRDAALDYGKGKAYPANYWLASYDNTARVFLHELLHADYFMSNGPADHVYDLKMTVRSSSGTEDVDVYGTANTKIMARYQLFDNEPLLRKAGWYTSHNADNMAWFATAKYVQEKIGAYPHLPIVSKQIVGTPTIKTSDFVLTYTDEKNPQFNLTTTDKSKLSAPDTCPNVLGSDGKTAGPKVDITSLADDSVYPADYIKQREQWIADAEKFSGGSDAPTTTTSSAAQPTCTGNQVQGDCETNVLPSAAPYSGPQAPSCAKADGSANAAARLNEDAVNTGANDYCDQLAKDKVLLGKNGSSPKPAIFKGKAENGRDMVMTVLFDESACPTDKKTSTLDFATYDKKKCVDGFSTTLAQICAQDSTWAAYNKDFTVMGGVWATDCALWSLQSQ